MANDDGMSGPHLIAAFLCEKVLQENDSVQSFIRVVDRFSVATLPPGVEAPAGFPLPSIQANLVIILKAGDLPANKYKLSVGLTKPNQPEVPPQEVEVFFNGSDDNGIAVVMPMVLPNPDEGLHWFEVYFEGGKITRVPMRVLYQKIQFA